MDQPSRYRGTRPAQSQEVVVSKVASLAVCMAIITVKPHTHSLTASLSASWACCYGHPHLVHIYTIDSQLNLNALVGVSGSSCPSHPVMSRQLPGDIAACGRCDVTIATLQVKYLTFTLPNSYGLSYSHPVVVGAPCN